jgi:LacI family transcriptional regulator, gluconate utilization system Gnt-I transcriptional repressor
VSETPDPVRRKTARKRPNGKRGASRPGRGSVTLESVAQIARVSSITVSRALNHPDQVAPATLERINQAIAQTGYVPNLLAGGLASNRSRLIAAIVPSIVNLVYAETIQYFSKYIREAGYQVLLGEVGYAQEAEEELVSAVLSRRPDAIFLTGVNHSADCRRRLLSARIPIVETWDLTPTPLDIVVGFSHEQVAQAVADHLFDRGYRKFAVVSADDPRAGIRHRAFAAALAQRGIKNIPTGIVTVPTSLQRGREGLEMLLAQGFSQGVVFCSSDILAHGVIAEAQSRGLSIPRDIAVFGFGDQDFAAYTYPALTTVRIDRRYMGKMAADSLLARLDDQPVAEDVVNVGFKIVQRETA